MAYDPNKRADVFVVTESPDKAPRTAKDSPVKRAGVSDRSDWTPQMFEYQAEMDRMVSHPRSEISCLLGLLEPVQWMSGLHSDVDGGWHDSRTNTFISFDTARQWIADRITELNLSPELVNSWPHERHPEINSQEFWRLDFETRMSRFRSSQD